LLIPNAALTWTPTLEGDQLEHIYEKYRIPKAAYTTHAENQHVVWKFVDDRDLMPVVMRAGVGDSAHTQLLKGDIREGDALITGSVGGAPSSQSKAPIPNRGGGR
jgi:hypothetical protein